MVAKGFPINGTEAIERGWITEKLYKGSVLLLCVSRNRLTLGAILQYNWSSILIRACPMANPLAKSIFLTTKSCHTPIMTITKLHWAQLIQRVHFYSHWAHVLNSQSLGKPIHEGFVQFSIRSPYCINKHNVFQSWDVSLLWQGSHFILQRTA